MELAAFLELMAGIAPPTLAEGWDNVGLLVSPTHAPTIRRVLLTIDVTRAVLGESVEIGAQALVAYHPPIFSGLKRLTPGNPDAERVLFAIEHGLLIYSPHTALDAVAGGVNDWLAEAVTANVKTKTVRAIEPRGQLIDSDDTRVGQGRYIELDEPCSLGELVEHFRRHLGVERLRVATCPEHAGQRAITSLALCAGAGGSVLAEVHADVYVTGEMRHHDVLAALQRGTSVILSEHTHTERGFLPVLKQQITARAPELDVRVSMRDADPLVVV